MIYFVEDDANIRELVIYTLENTGKSARGFENAQALYFREPAVEKPEMLLLDITLPGEDGLSILKKLRAGKLKKFGLAARMPVIILTAKGAEYDKVRFLDAGADDYLVKPFGMMELTARIRAVLRRSNAVEESRDKILTAGNITLNTSALTAFISGKKLELTAKEFELFHVLLQNRGAVLSRDRLLNLVWGYEFTMETRTVDVHIRTLRQKLATCGVQEEYIETVRGIGYRLADEYEANL